MSEWTLVWLVPIRLFIIGVFVFLYIIGGRNKKWIRRWLGGGLFGASLIGLSRLTGHFNWWFLTLPLAYPIVLSLGYGGDHFWEKMARRAIYGLLLGGIGFFVGILAGTWFMAGFQLALALIANVSLGLKNPVPAVHEEALIAIFSVVCVPFMI